jgi:hypothetical protein
MNDERLVKRLAPVYTLSGAGISLFVIIIAAVISPDNGVGQYPVGMVLNLFVFPIGIAILIFWFDHRIYLVQPVAVFFVVPGAGKKFVCFFSDTWRHYCQLVIFVVERQSIAFLYFFSISIDDIVLPG